MSGPSPAALLQQVLRDYEALWAERDPVRRKALIAACLLEDATIVGPGYLLRGWQEIDADAARLQQARPGQRASIEGGIDAHANLARFAVKVEDAAGNVLAEGLDVTEHAPDGRIQRVITFWGPVPRAGIRHNGSVHA